MGSVNIWYLFSSEINNGNVQHRLHTDSSEAWTAFLNGPKHTRSLIGMDFIHGFSYNCKLYLTPKQKATGELPYFPEWRQLLILFFFKFNKITELKQTTSTKWLGREPLLSLATAQPLVTYITARVLGDVSYTHQLKAFSIKGCQPHQVPQPGLSHNF